MRATHRGIGPWWREERTADTCKGGSREPHCQRGALRQSAPLSGTSSIPKAHCHTAPDPSPRPAGQARWCQGWYEQGSLRRGAQRTVNDEQHRGHVFNPKKGRRGFQQPSAEPSAPLATTRSQDRSSGPPGSSKVPLAYIECMVVSPSWGAATVAS